MGTQMQLRRSMLGLLAGTLLALPLGPITQVASASCADPRGPAFCPNDGRVSWPTFGGTTHASAASAGTQNVQQGGWAPAIQGRGPDNTAASISIDPPVAGVGDTITVSGQGLGAGQSVWINLAQTQLGAKQLTTVDGSNPQVAADGTLSSSLVLPDMPDWAVGQVSICVIGGTSSAVCTPFTMIGSDSGAAATAADAQGLGQSGLCTACQVAQNNQARLSGVYNSGSGRYEYHGARP